MNSIRRSFAPPVRPILIGCGLALILGSTGCTSMKLPAFGVGSQSQYAGANAPSQSGDHQSLSEKSYYAVREAAANNAIVLQVIGDRDPIRVLPLPDDGNSVRVSDLLRQSGISRKFGGVEAVVFRAATGMPNGIRMEVKMSSNGQNVQPACDYALQAGDRIQVKKRQASDALETLLGVSLGG